MATSTVNTNKPILPRGADVRPIDSYNRAKLYSGKALDFDGVNDYVTVENITDTYKSFCLYFKPDADITAASSYERLFGIYEQYHGISTGSATGIVAGETLVFMPNGGGRFATTMEFVADTWYHVAVVAKESDNTYLMYINGQDKTDLSAGTHIPSAAIKVRLAWDVQESGAKFNGQIANFKAFNTALTAAQIADLYNNPEKIVPTGVDNTALKLWLPMMESAGTTAYDGSGNGNHGRIAGATYVNGVGAPVAQTSVIDWNKLYDFDGSDLANVSTYLDTTGTKTYKVHFNSHDVTRADQQIFQFWNNTDALGVSGTINFFGSNSGVLGMRGFGSNANFNIQSWSGLTNNTFYELEFTIDWDVESITSATLNGVASDGTQSSRLDTTNNGLYLGARVGTYHLVGIINYFEVVGEEKWTNASGFKSQSGSYDMTISGSPTQILAPQGLTTGRDITGVNLFESVRKQGALNLDGSSWAEVHDNASLDVTTAVTLEVWVYRDGESGYFGFVGKWINNGNRCYLLATEPGNVMAFYVSKNGTALAQNSYTSSATGWHHFVGTEDGTNLKFYVDGVLVDTETSISGDISESDYNVEIGRYNNSTPNAYANQIAQPRIYNRALTASEVLNNYNATKDLYI